MKISYNHSFDKQKAFSLLENFAQYLKQKYADDIQKAELIWSEDKEQAKFFTTVKNYNINGILKNQDNYLTIDLDLPLFIRPFKNQISELIISTLNEIFKNGK